MRKIILYLFAFIASTGLCQNGNKTATANKKIDSLFAVLKTEKEDTNKVNTLNALSWQLFLKANYPKADSLARNCLQLSKQLNFKKGMGAAYGYIGLIYYYQGNYPEALANQLNSLKIEKEIGGKYDMGIIYENTGNIYWSQGNYPEALANYLQSLKIAEEIGGKKDMGNAYANIGNIYWSQGNYSEALANYLKSLKIDEEIGNKLGMGNAYENIGLIYNDQGNYHEAMANCLKSLKIGEEIGNKLGMGSTYGYIGDIYKAQGNFPEALANYLQNLKIDEGIGSKYGMGFAYVIIGSIFTSTKKYGAAKAYLDSAIILSKSIGEKDVIRDSYNYWSAYDSATGDYKKALADYKMYVVYKDSLKNDENTKKIVSQQMQYDFDKKEQAAKDEQDKKDAIAATESKRQKVIIGFVIAIALAVAIIALIILRSLRITRKQKDIIELQKSEVENKNLVIEQKNKDILDSITYAKRLQDAILPPLSLIEKYFPESFVLYKPKDIVAGDFYWMEREGDVILLAACDCTGHGVPGALVSVVCSNALNRAVKEFHITDPGKILDKTREFVLETFSQGDTSGQKSEGNIQDGMDISLLSITRSHSHTHSLSWSGAYNSLWYIENGELKEIQADKQPIGKTDNPKPFTTHTIQISPSGGGGWVYLFTDGFADQFGGTKGKKFKYKQLKEKLLAISQKPMAVQKAELEKEFALWKGELEQTDDVCVIGIRVE